MVSKFSDVAVGLSGDKLGFRDYADGVIATLDSLSKDDTPFTIGIFGSWGSGKTSFMQIMQELLQSRGYETIFFKSWEYGNEEKPWIPFMIKVVDELFEDGVVKKDLIRNVALFSTDVVLQTGTQGRVSTGAISNLIERSRKNRVFKNWLDKDTKTVIERVTKIEEFKKRIKERAEGSYLFSIDTPVLEKLFSYCKVSIRAIAKRCREVNVYHINKYKEDLNNDVIPKKLKREFKDNELSKAKENFEKHPKTFKYSPKVHKERSRSDNALKEKDKWEIPYGDGIYIVEKEDDKIKIYEKSKKGKIIIFIDDLDRIPEEKIVDFLDSLKIFLDISGCIFVLGCDYEILKNALRKKHGEEEIYKDYFDKIVQTEFYIPKISKQAIKNYLHSLTGWNEEEIKKCTQLVIHSIGGNPRKIKRVVNATMLIKSVFEKRLATSLEEFERPTIRNNRRKEGNEEEIEKPMALIIKISSIFTLTEVFDLLFDKEVLFKLMCMREQWFGLYQRILSEEKKRSALISLQDADTKTDIQKYLLEFFSTTKEQGDKSKEDLEDLTIKKIIKDPPKFHDVNDLNAYLTFLEISSPEAGISMEYAEPGVLPIDLFNRYMMFERINKGKVEKDIIKKRIDKKDWENGLSSYRFFIGVISAFGYDDLLKDLFEKNQEQIVKKIRDASTDSKEKRRLLYTVKKKDKDTARELLDKIKGTIAEEIRDSTDTRAIGEQLDSMREIDEDTARVLLDETKDTYADKIKASTDTRAIRYLLDSVRVINEETARKLSEKPPEEVLVFDKTILDELLSGDFVKTNHVAEVIKKMPDSEKQQYLDRTISKLKHSNSKVRLNAVMALKGIGDAKAVEPLIAAFKDGYPNVRYTAEEALGSIGAEAVEPLIGALKDKHVSVRESAARALGTMGSPKAIKALTEVSNNDTNTYVRSIAKNAIEIIKAKQEYADKIISTIDPMAIGQRLDSVRVVEEETASVLLNQTKDTYADKIIASSDLVAIGGLLYSVRKIDKETASVLLNQTKDTYADKIIASSDLRAIRVLLDSVRGIEEETASELLNQTKNTYANKIIASSELGAIGWLLGRVSGIDKESASVLLNETKDMYADKIIASSELGAIWVLLYNVSRIDKESASELLNETKNTYTDKIIASTDPKAIGLLLKSVRQIDPETAEWLEKETNFEAKEN